MDQMSYWPMGAHAKAKLIMQACQPTGVIYKIHWVYSYKRINEQSQYIDIQYLSRNPSTHKHACINIIILFTGMRSHSKLLEK